jgi:hypothetical protein
MTATRKGLGAGSVVSEETVGAAVGTGAEPHAVNIKRMVMRTINRNIFMVILLGWGK